MIVIHSISMGQNQVSLIERCPLFRGSFFRGFTVYIIYLTPTGAGWVEVKERDEKRGCCDSTGQ